MLKKLLFILGLIFLPFTAFAATTVPWTQVNLSDTFITPSLINGVILGIQIKGASSTLQNFTAVNATTSQATSTNLFSTSGTFTNLFGTNITGFGLSSCTGTSALTFSGTTFGCAAQPQGTITSLTGDVTGSGTGAVATTLATVNGNVGSFTNANITVNGKGLVTAASNGSAGGVTSVSNADGTLTISPTTGLVVASRPAITGDITIAGGSNASVLATVNSNVGSFGGVNSIPNFTVNGKGLITAAGVNTPSIPASEITSGTFGTGSYTFPANLTITGNATTTALAITSLGVPAGTFLAVNPQGSVIATTTPAGSSGVTSVATTNGITGGTITTTGTIQLDQTFGQVNTAASTTYVGGVTIGKATTTQATSTNQFATTGTFTNLTGTSFTGFGLTSCSGSTFLQWSGGTFACGTPSGSGGTDVNWSFFNNSGIRVATTTNNVLIGASATTSLARLDVIEPSTKYVATFDASNAGAGSPALIQIGGRSGIGATNMNDLKNDGNGNFSIQTGSATLDTEGTDRLSITKTGAATFSGTLTSTGLFTGTAGLQANASSTFQNFTGVNATTSNATTTTLFVSGNASTTNFFGSGLSTCNGVSSALIYTGTTGLFGCNAISSGSGGGNSKFATSTGTLLSITPNGGLNVGLGIGTSTPYFALEVGSTTAPQFSLDRNDAVANAKHLITQWDGSLYTIGTSSDTTLTSTSTAFTIQPNTPSSLTVGSSTPTFTPVNGLVTLGSNGTNGSTTISMGKLQFDGYSTTGTRQCAFFVGSAFVVTSGACTP